MEVEEQKVKKNYVKKLGLGLLSLGILGGLAACGNGKADTASSWKRWLRKAMHAHNSRPVIAITWV